MASIGEQQTWAAIASMARSLQQIAKIMEEAAEAFKEKAPSEEELPLTKAAWKSEVLGGVTEQGFDDWLAGRRDV